MRGGYILKSLNSQGKIGVEINPAAILEARGNGVTVYAQLFQIENESVDGVVSNHAMEHVESPIDVLREMWRILKPGACAVLVVPCDAARFGYSIEDPDFHLFSWSAGNLGNLARAAGFEVIVAEEIVHRWPPKWAKLYKMLGARVFHWICFIYGSFKRDRTQVWVVARRAHN